MAHTAHGRVPKTWASALIVGVPYDYHDPSVVAPPCYDTNHQNVVLDEVISPGTVINFNDVPTGETTARSAVPPHPRAR